MHRLRSPSKCGGCGLPFRQRPPALSAATMSLGCGAIAGLDSRPRDAQHGRGSLPATASPPRRHDSPARRPAVARSSAKYRKVRGDRLPSRYAPIAAETCDMAHRAFAVHLPARRDMIAAWHVGHADCVPGRVAPTDARVAPRRVRLPGLRVSPITAAALRSTPNCFDAPRTWLWTSGLAPARPSHATMGRHLCAAYCTASSAHHQRRVFSSPCRQRVRDAFSAPSLPLRRVRQRARIFHILPPVDRRTQVVTGRGCTMQKADRAEHVGSSAEAQQRKRG